MTPPVPSEYLPDKSSDTARFTRHFRTAKFDFGSFFFSALK